MNSPTVGPYGGTKCPELWLAQTIMVSTHPHDTHRNTRILIANREPQTADCKPHTPTPGHQCLAAGWIRDS